MKPIDNNTDYYLENDRVIFTAAFHIRRGSCCGNSCRHCPYEPKNKRNNTVKQKQYDTIRQDNPPGNGEG